MKNKERILIATSEIQQNITELKGDFQVLVSKQAEYLAKFEEGGTLMKEHAERLRSLEATQMLHKGYFALFGAGLLLCGGLLANLFININ